MHSVFLAEALFAQSQTALGCWGDARKESLRPGDEYPFAGTIAASRRVPFSLHFDGFSGRRP